MTGFRPHSKTYIKLLSLSSNYNMTIDRIDTGADYAEKGLHELDHGDSVEGFEAVAVTEDAVYGLDDHFTEAYVEDVTGEDVYARVVNDERERTSASSPVVDNAQLDELAGIKESPFAILEDGTVMERSGQSTPSIGEPEEISVENSPTAGRYGFDRAVNQ